MKLVALAFVLFAAAITTACAPELADEAAADVKADTATTPSGEFDAVQPTLGELAVVVINRDATFRRHFQAIDCIPLKGCWETGTYRFTRATTTDARYIEFYDTDGVLMDRYAYSYQAGAMLALRRDDGTEWRTLAPVLP